MTIPNYWELRKIISKIVPRRSQLFDSKDRVNAVKEKGRKSGYQQFDVTKREWVKNERLLNTEEINSFLEISIRAQACPMPLNLDVWDSTRCPFACVYCFPSGTKILMSDGIEKSIERIKPGDRVMSFNEKTKDIEPAEVSENMNRTFKEDLICIETEEGQILKMTPEHPVYTVNGWIEAKDLKEEDEVLVW